ncbi:putative anion transporter 6 [Arachis hypogaea]|nr:putative anion transporter 6 [Arachis hypogaea]
MAFELTMLDDDNRNRKLLLFRLPRMPPKLLEFGHLEIPQRYKLIRTTSLAFVICNMDKVNLSIAIIPMSHQFGWNSSMAGLVQSSFF